MSVKIEDLKFGYGVNLTLDGISLELKQGEFVGILGPNGCGKSTLLKNIMRILDSKSGIIEVADKNVKDYSLKELAKILGFVPQKTALNAPLSVEEILLMGRFCRIKSEFNGYEKLDYEKVEQMMNLLDIAKFAKRNAYELSGGEFGRVLIARALVSEPQILLLDEPTSALDLNYALNIMKICKKLTKELNLLSVMVIHDLNLAALFCDKVFMLKGGKIRYQGAPKELYTKEILHEIYDLECEILNHNGDPLIALTKE